MSCRRACCAGPAGTRRWHGRSCGAPAPPSASAWPRSPASAGVPCTPSTPSAARSTIWRTAMLRQPSASASWAPGARSWPGSAASRGLRSAASLPGPAGASTCPAPSSACCSTGSPADAAERVRLADEPALDGYCRAVAGTVGLLAVRIFGAEGADAFALAPRPRAPAREHPARRRGGRGARPALSAALPARRAGHPRPERRGRGRPSPLRARLDAARRGGGCRLRRGRRHARRPRPATAAAGAADALELPPAAGAPPPPGLAPGPSPHPPRPGARSCVSPGWPCRNRRDRPAARRRRRDRRSCRSPGRRTGRPRRHALRSDARRPVAAAGRSRTGPVRRATTAPTSCSAPTAMRCASWKRSTPAESWIEPEPDGLPVLDLATGEAHRIGLSPWSWLRPAQRPPGLGLRQLARLVRLGLPGPDRSVASVMGESTFTRALIAPLTVAALNTPPEEASASRLGTCPAPRVLAPGSARLLVARRGLGPDLIEPALRALERCGVVPAYGRPPAATSRWRADEPASSASATQEVTLGQDDRVVLALPPHALARLLPDLDLPQRFEPIVNLHFPIGAGPVRFVGLLGGLAQWVLFRPGMASVTISAARAAVDLPAADLAARVWPEVQRAADVCRPSAAGRDAGLPRGQGATGHDQPAGRPSPADAAPALQQRDARRRLALAAACHHRGRGRVRHGCGRCAARACSADGRPAR